MSDNFYTTAFVSHDFVQNDPVERAEVFVVLGQGRVVEVNTSNRGDSKQLVIDAGHTDRSGRSIYSKGWAPADSEVIKKGEAAHKSGEPIDFRIETFRQKQVDRSLPIDDLRKGMENARENVYNSMASVKFADEDNWTIGIMRTNPIEDKPRIGGKGAFDMTPEELGLLKPNGGGESSGAVLASKAEPWVNYSKFYLFLAKQAKENGVELNEAKLKAGSNGLAKVVTKLQLTIDSDLEKVDFSRPSYVDAQELVLLVAEGFYPLNDTVFVDKSSLVAWITDIQSQSLNIYEFSVNSTSNIK